VSYNGVEINNISSNDLMLGVRGRFGGCSAPMPVSFKQPLYDTVPPRAARPFDGRFFVGVFARPWLEGNLARDPHLTLLDAESMGIPSPF
jgi:hypothetical protein